MAYKVGTTIVIDDSGNVDWSRIANKPAIGTGDISAVSCKQHDAHVRPEPRRASLSELWGRRLHVELLCRIALWWRQHRSGHHHGEPPVLNCNCNCRC